MKNNSCKSAKKVMKHLGHDIHESKESIKEDKALMKKMAKAKKKR